MFGKKIFLLTTSLTLMAAAAFGAVTISDTGAKEAQVKDHNYSRVNRTVTFNNNGPVTYSIYYSYVNDPEYTKENPNAVLPMIGDVSAGTTGLGINFPWYQNGFLGVEINGKLLTYTLAKEFKVVEQGKRGVYDVTWAPEWGDIRARFVSMQDDDKLYLELRVDPKVQALRSVSVKFVCLPSASAAVSKKSQWISTAVRNVEHGPDVTVLDPKKESWVLYYDAMKSSSDTCALIYVPEEALEARIDTKSNHVDCTYISYPLTAGKMHFVLYNFPGKYKTREEAFNFLKENEGSILDSLKKIDFGQ
jgi:hypothetical protein